MRVFPSERDRQRSDRRTVWLFFVAIGIVAAVFAAVVTVHRVLQLL